MQFMGGNLSVCDSCSNSFYVKEPGVANLLSYLDEKEINKIKTLDIFPTKGNCETCSRRSFDSENVILISAGMYNTPGCFVSGGEKGLHYSLLLKSTCRKAAQNIVSYFNGAAYAENEYVFVGVSQDNLLILNRLMLHILDNGKISSSVVKGFKKIS